MGEGKKIHAKQLLQQEVYVAYLTGSIVYQF